MPCFVETWTLFGWDRGISLQEWGPVWKIQRLCLSIQRLCLLTQRPWFQGNRVFNSFKYIFVAPNIFFSSPWHHWNISSYKISGMSGVCFGNTSICLKPYRKLKYIWNFIHYIGLTKQAPWFIKQGICLYQKGHPPQLNRALGYISTLRPGLLNTVDFIQEKINS